MKFLTEVTPGGVLILAASICQLLGSLRIDDFGATTPLDFVTCLLRMLVRELTDAAPKSTTLVTAICRRPKTAGRAARFRCVLPVIKVCLEKLLRGVQIVIVS